MAETSKSNVMLQPPRPGMDTNGSEFYSLVYELWNRSGGYASATTNLNGLKASVPELNTLVGIRTDDSVQEQIDLKSNKADLGTMSTQDADNVSITGGTINSVGISGSVITIAAGATANEIPIGATLHVNTTAVGNSNPLLVTSLLMSHTLNANTLSINNDYLDVLAWGTTATNANNKRFHLRLGTTVLLDSLLTITNNQDWIMNCKIVRTSANTQQSIGDVSWAVNHRRKFVLVAEDLTTDLDIYCTACGVAADDVVQHGFCIKWFRGI